MKKNWPPRSFIREDAIKSLEEAALILKNMENNNEETTLTHPFDPAVS